MWAQQCFLVQVFRGNSGTEAACGHNNVFSFVLQFFFLIDVGSFPGCELCKSVSPS